MNISLNMRLLIALFVAFVLTVLPLPDLLHGIRPPWILLLVLYVQFYLPHYFNITLILILGLCLDVLLSTVIGEHAFALLLTTWISSGKTRRFYFFSMIQQTMLIASFCFIYQLCLFLMESFLGYHNPVMMLVASTLLTILLWPWVRVLADNTLCYDTRL